MSKKPQNKARNAIIVRAVVHSPVIEHHYVWQWVFILCSARRCAPGLSSRLLADFVAVLCSFLGSWCFMRDNIDVTIEVIACKYEPPFAWPSSRKFANWSNGIDRDFYRYHQFIFFYNLKCTFSDLLADHWIVNNIMLVVLFLTTLSLWIKVFWAKWPKAPLFCFQWWWCGSDESRFFPEARGSLILLRRYKVQWRQ